METKKCSKCGEVKPVGEFHKRKKGSKDGYNSKCKNCINKRQTEIANENRERQRQYMRDYRKRHPERVKEKQRKQVERRKKLNLKSTSLGYIDGVIKKCTKCGEVKNISEFSKDKKYTDGLDCQCKKCKNNSMENWKKNNPESYRDKCKRQQLKFKIKYYSDENVRKKRAEKDREYRQNNPEKILERNRLYNKNNKEKVDLRRKNYLEKNGEKLKEWRKNYFDDNVVVMNRKHFNLKTCDEEIKPLVELALVSKKLNKKIKNIGESK